MNPGPSPWRAFTLLELLLAIAIGLSLCGVLVRSLLATGVFMNVVTRHHQAKAAQRRTLELMRSEALQAVAIRTAPAAGSACAPSGRVVLLELETRAGRISYSVGREPSAIWRPEVLMRCGPAYGLYGQLSTGHSQNRVVLDQLRSSDGFIARRYASGRIKLQISQQLSVENPGKISSEIWLVDGNSSH
jgi:type II secretory pathway pseudopilin PulG